MLGSAASSPFAAGSPGGDDELPPPLQALAKNAESKAFLASCLQRYYPPHTLQREYSDDNVPPPVWPPCASPTSHAGPHASQATSGSALRPAASPLYSLEGLFTAYKQAVAEEDEDPMVGRARRARACACARCAVALQRMCLAGTRSRPMLAGSLLVLQGLFGRCGGRAAGAPPSVHLTKLQLNRLQAKRKGAAAAPQLLKAPHSKPEDGVQQWGQLHERLEGQGSQFALESGAGSTRSSLAPLHLPQRAPPPTLPAATGHTLHTTSQLRELLLQPPLPAYAHSVPPGTAHTAKLAHLMGMAPKSQAAKKPVSSEVQL